MKNPKTVITQVRLHELLSYDPETGLFRWKSRPGFSSRGWSESFVGKIAGTSNNGYVQIQLDFMIYRAHRLAFLYMTGELPEIVDHVNMNRSDNRWSNLRRATRHENYQNVPKRAWNRSGYKGVTKHGRNRWRARIRVRGTLFELGYFDDITSAAAAYEAAAKKHFGDYART